MPAIINLVKKAAEKVENQVGKFEELECEKTLDIRNLPISSK